MTDPTITCPSCATEIKLTESLAAPLIHATRQEYEAKIARKDLEFAQREAGIKAQREKVEQDRATIEDQVREKLNAGRAAIAAEEVRKAKTAAAADLQSKATELAEAQQLLAQRDRKLQEAQKEQTVLLRKQRELDEAKRELDLTIEKRVQDSLVEVRQKAKIEADIAAEEVRKAKAAAAADLQSKATELAEAQQLLVQRDRKLQEAQKEQVVLLRKQRELDEAKRELDLTIEKRIQDSLVEVRQKAKIEGRRRLEAQGR